MSAPTVFPLQPLRTAETFSSLPYPRFQGRGKRGRGKVVSWPPENQICQVRLFLSNDVPSALGPAQTIAGVSQSRSFPARGGDLDELLDVPPGFQCSFAKRAKVNPVVDRSMSVDMSWASPRKFVQESDWLVAEGDESKEVSLQKQRELRVLEAFYPRLTSVPDSSAEPAEFSMRLDDDAIPVIPLASVEDEDEHGEGLEHGVKAEPAKAVAEDGELIEVKPRPPTSGGAASPADVSGRELEPVFCKAADPKAMAAAAAAAACMAMQKIGASGVVDQELLVEILRNPVFSEKLSSLFSESGKDLAGSIHGQGIGIVKHCDSDPSDIKQFGGPVNKAPLTTGWPSPVSVLSDWTQEPRALSSMSDSSDAKHVSSSMPASQPFSHSHTTYPSSIRENPMLVEPVSAPPLQGGHAYMQASGAAGRKVAHMPNDACAQSGSMMQSDRSCGMPAPLAPPPQNVPNFHSSSHGGMQSAHHAAPRRERGMYAAAAAPSERSFLDATPRGLQNENSRLGSTSRTGVKAARLCMYFNSPRGCRNGRNCAFLHQTLNQESNFNAR